MSEPTAFTVRPSPPTSSLDGAFRVHLTAKDLDLLGLKLGELCTLHSGDGSSAVGIAWRSLDTSQKPQLHPVKLSEPMRDSFGCKLGSQITIKKINNGKIAHADRVVVIDVSDNDKIDLTKDDKSWKWRCGMALGNVEAITTGVAFEASSRKGLRKRFLIEHIESSEATAATGLYVFDDRSQIALQDEESEVTPEAPIPRSIAVTSEGIGGLNKQIELLNKRLSRLIGDIRGKRLPPQVQRNGGILLYGPEGTGKTLLLNHLTQAPWKKVVRIDQSALAGTTSKNQLSVRNLFAEAVAHQPSLVIMDNLESIAGTQQRDFTVGNLAPALVAELDRLRNTHVLVVAAAHNPNDIDKSLRTPGRLRYEIEIPIPDMRARIQILKVMQGETGTAELAEAIGERTHGFVGQDLEALFNNALEHALDRHQDTTTNWLPIQRTDDESQSQITLVNGMENCSIDDRPRTADTDDDADLQVTLADYEKALLEVRPTAMREIFLETPKVLWSDIGGSGDVKKTLNEVVEWPLKFEEHMQALSLTPQKGILFYGPPGCSKTLTAKAVATESGLNFIAVKGAELTSMYVGESERSVREVFRKARAAAPSIIFFDEIDSIGSERDSSGTKGLNVLTTLLNEMDGIESLKGVLVLAATNKPEVLDPALLRPGRFDSLIYIAPPSQSARKEILRIRTRSVPLADDVDIEDLSERTEGFSGAEIVEICLNACRAAMRRRVEIVTQPRDADVVDQGAIDELMKVSKPDFDTALATAVRRITPEMTEGYEHWRDGLTKKL
ncbi:AAA-domain-containing protein [Aureobasidium pullulans]|uniref:AAA-domain-containing protein n=1 Tax=Aureobasidium pullulans TaxID=5580 RepID=A0A4S9LQ27_AURPU|nr:AAA-domain-containing protein [Aureobasidium pullulans]